MGDAIERSPTKVHAFFKQHKRKQPPQTHCKGADVAPKTKNTNITQVEDVPNNNNNAAPSTSSTIEGLPNDIIPTELGNEFDEDLVIPEIRLNATNDELVPPTTLNDISDEELEYHLSHCERDSIETIIHSGINGRSTGRNPTRGHDQRQDRWEVC